MDTFCARGTVYRGFWSASSTYMSAWRTITGHMCICTSGPSAKLCDAHAHAHVAMSMSRACRNAHVPCTLQWGYPVHATMRMSRECCNEHVPYMSQCAYPMDVAMNMSRACCNEHVLCLSHGPVLCLSQCACYAHVAYVSTLFNMCMCSMCTYRFARWWSARRSCMCLMQIIRSLKIL